MATGLVGEAVFEAGAGLDGGAADFAVGLRLAGTTWMVPQCWQRQTPPAKASSTVRMALQLVQEIRIMLTVARGNKTRWAVVPGRGED